jgi:hypothetical protein
MRLIIALLTLLFLSILSCEANREYNFDVIQIVNLQTPNQIGIKCPGKGITLDLAYDNLTYDELHRLVSSKTYSTWYVPNDTIWVMKDYSHNGKVFEDIYFVSKDSVLATSYVKSYMPYYCPEY